MLYIDAREFHKFLESSQDFSTWIKNRMDKFDFIENLDHTIYSKILEKMEKGRPFEEYAITIDMAKELAMVENNEKVKDLAFMILHNNSLVRKDSCSDPQIPSLSVSSLNFNFCKTHLVFSYTFGGVLLKMLFET